MIWAIWDGCQAILSDSEGDELFPISLPSISTQEFLSDLDHDFLANTILYWNDTSYLISFDNSIGINLDMDSKAQSFFDKLRHHFDSLSFNLTDFHRSSSS